MNHLEIISLWIENLKIPSENYTVQVTEQDKEVLFKISIDNDYIGRLLGVKGTILQSLKRLLNSTYKKYRKKVKIEVSER